MTRADLLDAVRDYLNRPSTTDATLGLWIAAVEGELNRILREHPRSQRRTMYTQDAHNPLLPLPTDLMQLIRLWVPSGPLAGAWRQYAPGFDDDALTCPFQRAWVARGMCVELHPVPSEDTTFALDYIAALEPLVQATDSNWVSRFFGDVYVYGCLREAAVYLKDDARLAGWTAEFQRRAAEVAAQGWGQNIATAPRVARG